MKNNNESNTEVKSPEFFGDQKKTYEKLYISIDKKKKNNVIRKSLCNEKLIRPYAEKFFKYCFEKREEVEIFWQIDNKIKEREGASPIDFLSLYNKKTGKRTILVAVPGTGRKGTPWEKKNSDIFTPFYWYYFDALITDFNQHQNNEEEVTFHFSDAESENSDILLSANLHFSALKRTCAERANVIEAKKIVDNSDKQNIKLEGDSAYWLNFKNNENTQIESKCNIRFIKTLEFSESNKNGYLYDEEERQLYLNGSKVSIINQDFLHDFLILKKKNKNAALTQKEFETHITSNGGHIFDKIKKEIFPIKINEKIQVEYAPPCKQSCCKLNDTFQDVFFDNEPVSPIVDSTQSFITLKNGALNKDELKNYLSLTHEKLLDLVNLLNPENFEKLTTLFLKKYFSEKELTTKACTATSLAFTNEFNSESKLLENKVIIHLKNENNKNRVTAYYLDENGKKITKIIEKSTDINIIHGFSKNNKITEHMSKKIIQILDQTPSEEEKLTLKTRVEDFLNDSSSFIVKTTIKDITQNLKKLSKEFNFDFEEIIEEDDLKHLELLQEKIKDIHEKILSSEKEKIDLYEEEKITEENLIEEAKEELDQLFNFKKDHIQFSIFGKNEKNITNITNNSSLKFNFEN